MPNINNCFHCKDKFNCYDRMMKGRIIQCKPEEHKEKVLNWKWWKLTQETPADRKRNREIYIEISNKYPIKCIKSIDKGHNI